MAPSIESSNHLPTTVISQDYPSDHTIDVHFNIMAVITRSASGKTTRPKSNRLSTTAPATRKTVSGHSSKAVVKSSMKKKKIVSSSKKAPSKAVPKPSSRKTNDVESEAAIAARIAAHKAQLEEEAEKSVSPGFSTPVSC